MPAAFLERVLEGHDVHTAQGCGWGGIKNGKLLTLAEEQQFEVFLMSDKNLHYQQDLSKRKIAIVELPTNRRVIVKKLVPRIIEVLSTINAQGYVQIDWHEN